MTGYLTILTTMSALYLDSFRQTQKTQALDINKIKEVLTAKFGTRFYTIPDGESSQINPEDFMHYTQNLTELSFYIIRNGHERTDS